MLHRFIAWIGKHSAETQSLRSQLVAANQRAMKIESENDTLRILVRALRDVNATLDRRLCEGDQ